jgi:hypothetical protein
MRYWTPKKVPGNPVVGIAVASYLNDDPRRRASLRCLVSAFQAQTYEHWFLRVVHDGPTDREGMRLLGDLQRDDARVTVTDAGPRRQQFGHPHRQEAMEYLVKRYGCEWLLCTNDDNYYAPVFLEWLLFTACNTLGCRFVHCDCVHSHQHWKYFKTEPRYKHLDLGGFLVHASLGKEVKFDNFAFNGDGDWIDRLVARCGPDKVQKVPRVLFVHN